MQKKKEGKRHATRFPSELKKEATFCNEAPSPIYACRMKLNKLQILWKYTSRRK
jgi:hypothetical protein